MNGKNKNYTRNAHNTLNTHNMNANLIIVRKSKHLNPNSKNIVLHYSTLLLDFGRQKVCENI